MIELSVIVPIFKVERYLAQCVDSILRQSYKDLEVILVDDGSPDNCGAMCDEYAKRDSRIKVVHKANGGLVSARKAGIEIARGRYITYVDGDDWLSDNTYEVLMRYVAENRADIVTAGFIEDFGTEESNYIDTMKPGYYSGEMLDKYLYETMLYDKSTGDSGIRPNVWSKIFSREVIYDCQMSVNNCINYGEDMACTYPALLKADSVYVTDECLYHYRRRADSITTERNLNYFEQIGILYKELAKVFFQHRKITNILMSQLNSYMKYLLNKGDRDLLNGILESSQSEMKPYYLFPFDKIAKGSKIVVYGAGVVGQDYIAQILSRRYVKLVAWVDKKYIEYAAKGYDVVDTWECYIRSYDYIVIAILKEHVAMEIKKELIANGVSESHIIWSLPVKVNRIMPRKKKIAFAVHRYGLEVNGGAELHCRMLAEHLKDKYEVEVFTSCANSVEPWDNYYHEGCEIINGVLVRRFRVEREQKPALAGQLYQLMIRNELEEPNQYFAENGPYCPALINFIKNHYEEYQAIIFFSYGTYISSLGLQTGLNNGLFIPTVHESISIRSLSYEKVFEGVQGFIYNSYEEREMVRSVFSNSDKKEMVTCVGFDEPDIDKIDNSIAKKYGEYMIYVGRISDSKNCQKLFDYFLNYKKRNASKLKLVLVGKEDGVKVPIHKDIIHAGFISDLEKSALIKGAKFLVNNSINESLSLVMLESMILGRPVIVNGNCDVMRGQCQRSNAGLYYNNYLEFEAVINYMLTHDREYEAMCENGVVFVRKNYTWSVVIKNICNFIETYKK